MSFLLSNKNVFEYLINKGICTEKNQYPSKIELKPAKNFNLLLTLPEGRQLLVKQEPRNREGKTASEFLREWQFQKMLHSSPDFSPILSSFSQAIHFDVENFIIVFNYFKDYRDVADFYSRENIFPITIATAISATVALIHRLTLDRRDYQEVFESSTEVFNNPAFEMIHSLKRLTPEIFGSYPADALKFFVLYQRYSSLEQAIAELSNAIKPCCLIHNDLKLNNILLANSWEEIVSQTSLPANSIIRLIDWEKSNWGDPASDLGTLIASYLQIWLYGLITSKTIAIEESLHLATTSLELLQPSIIALVNTYLSNFPEILERRPDFLLRVVQFSGLALIQAILATLQHQKTFDNTEICMLQVAKTLLCRPEQSIQTVFGMSAFELSHHKDLRFFK
ncbi:phosphotransferase [Komarekiella sp. 'clone 1']|uniref:Phosphotransferase n=1 Tax=Komarekiella delphini-convector SJRDD-AB1 TaxID=2593771 RepID=A0AA40SVB1_9NOST|nr:phosphotransferase [Komarekiella delphini-convector]MBD6615949.1 phosphotransferase [Komarekiella delphini-convector SJRDD-AB1]